MKTSWVVQPFAFLVSAKGGVPLRFSCLPSLRSTLQNYYPTSKFDRSTDIASVIVIFMVTCRVLTRSIIYNRPEQRSPVAQLCFLVSPLEATLPRFSASVNSKRLTSTLSYLECALMKKPRGEEQLSLTRLRLTSNRNARRYYRRDVIL